MSSPLMLYSMKTRSGIKAYGISHIVKIIAQGPMSQSACSYYGDKIPIVLVAVKAACSQSCKCFVKRASSSNIKLIPPAKTEVIAKS